MSQTPRSHSTITGSGAAAFVAEVWGGNSEGGSVLGGGWGGGAEAQRAQLRNASSMLSCSAKSLVQGVFSELGFTYMNTSPRRTAQHARPAWPTYQHKQHRIWVLEAGATSPLLKLDERVAVRRDPEKATE
jgi:hypothetical protein